VNIHEDTIAKSFFETYPQLKYLGFGAVFLSFFASLFSCPYTQNIMPSSCLFLLSCTIRIPLDVLLDIINSIILSLSVTCYYFGNKRKVMEVFIFTFSGKYSCNNRFERRTFFAAYPWLKYFDLLAILLSFFVFYCNFCPLFCSVWFCFWLNAVILFLSFICYLLGFKLKTRVKKVPIP